MDDSRNEVVQDTVGADEPEAEVVAEAAWADGDAELARADDATLNTPLATLEMRVAPNGERRYTGRERWLRELNQGIATHPDVPTNYVLRGELALETRDYAQAVADFEKALELAAAQVETNDWGILAQVMQDRADRGLAQARRRLRK